MKRNLKRILAVAVALVMLMTVMPVMADGETPVNVRVEAAGRYENNFDAITKADLLNDFKVYHNDYVTNEIANDSALTDYSANAETYTSVANGNLTRVRGANESAGEVNRMFYNMTYNTYKNQTFRNFVLEADVRFGAQSGSSFHAITVGALGQPMRVNGGFSVLAWNSTEGQYYRIVTAQQAQSIGWYLPDGVLRNRDDSKFVHLKLVVNDGVATLYLDDMSTAVTSADVGSVEGYVSLVSGLPTSIFDNLKITSTDPVDYQRVEALGRYENNFNGMQGTITDDFAFYYDPSTNNASGNGFKDLVADGTLTSYFTAANDNLGRVVNTATENGTDYNRPYYNMLYATYKNQTFRNYTLEVDLNLTQRGNTFYGITLGNAGSEFKENGGYTLGFWYESDTKTKVFLGTAAQVRQDMDDWWMHSSDNVQVLTTATGNPLKHIVMTVKDGIANATVSCGDASVTFTDKAVGDVTGYVALASGPSGTAYYDNLKITALDAPEHNYVQETGVYKNDFNVASVPFDDFAFYYDPGTNKLSGNSFVTMDRIALPGYLNMNGGRLNRFHNNSELDYGNDGNRPYWCMLYSTYKKQQFTDYDLSVDAYYPSYGSSFQAITLGRQNCEFKENGGYTLGFGIDPWNNSQMDLFFGTSAEAAQDFNDFYVHNAVAMTRAEGDLYHIEISVRNGLGTVKINGVTYFTNKEIGKVTGYLALANGTGGGYYDNLEIVEHVKTPVEIKTEQLAPYLKVAAQLKAGDDSCKVRLISMLDNDLENYGKVGFAVTIGEETVDYDVNTVYTSYLGENDEKVTAASYGADYFTLVPITVGAGQYGDEITVVPYVDMADGTRIEGAALSFVLNEYL